MIGVGIGWLTSIQHPVWNLVLAKALNISSLTAKDDMMIRAGYYYYTNDMFKCDQTIQEYYQRTKGRRKDISDDECWNEAVKIVTTRNRCDIISDREFFYLL